MLLVFQDAEGSCLRVNSGQRKNDHGSCEGFSCGPVASCDDLLAAKHTGVRAAFEYSDMMPNAFSVCPWLAHKEHVLSP